MRCKNENVQTNEDIQVTKLGYMVRSLSQRKLVKNRSWVVAQLRVSDLPNHTTPEVWHVFLGEVEFFSTPREGFKELACEHATIIPILLLGCRLERYIFNEPIPMSIDRTVTDRK